MAKVSGLIITLLLTACLAGAADSPAKIPIILDTDIGSDIDDAFALALVMKSPELQLLAVTTVSADTAARAQIAAKMLWEAGGEWRNVPVVAGVPGEKQPMDQAAWAKDFASPQILKGNAIDFLRSELRNYPGQITIIAIGELSNLAAVIRSDPVAAKKIKRIALMGGSIARGYEPGSSADAEWNINSNPIAAQIVFSSGIPILMAPLDVTAMLKLDAAGRSRVFSSSNPNAASLAALYKLWNRETPILFDPMAVTMLIHPGICQTKDLAIEVDDQGYTRVVQGKPANATVGLQTDPSKFFEFYLNRVAGR